MTQHPTRVWAAATLVVLTACSARPTPFSTGIPSYCPLQTVPLERLQADKDHELRVLELDSRGGATVVWPHEDSAGTTVGDAVRQSVVALPDRWGFTRRQLMYVTAETPQALGSLASTSACRHDAAPSDPNLTIRTVEHLVSRQCEVDTELLERARSERAALPDCAGLPPEPPLSDDALGISGEASADPIARDILSDAVSRLDTCRLPENITLQVNYWTGEWTHWFNVNPHYYPSLRPLRGPDEPMVPDAILRYLSVHAGNPPWTNDTHSMTGEWTLTGGILHTNYGPGTMTFREGLLAKTEGVGGPAEWSYQWSETETGWSLIGVSGYWEFGGYKHASVRTKKTQQIGDCVIADTLELRDERSNTFSAQIVAVPR